MEKSAPLTPEPSVSFSSDTVTGYVEYYYWKNYYCDPTQAGAMSSENWNNFKDVEMYRGKSQEAVEQGQNMEYLWNMTNPNVGGEDPLENPDPLANSLFNITTLKTLVALGQQTPDITGADKDLVFSKDFDLDKWYDIAETLELTDPGDADIG